MRNAVRSTKIQRRESVGISPIRASGGFLTRRELQPNRWENFVKFFGELQATRPSCADAGTKPICTAVASRSVPAHSPKLLDVFCPVFRNPAEELRAGAAYYSAPP